MLSKRRYLLVAFIAILSGIPLFVLNAAGSDKGPPRTGWMKQFTVNEEPGPAPDVKFTNGAGEKITLADFKGRVVLVNFWATWCAPCIKEMPSLDKLQAKLGGDDFQVVAVNEDRGGAKIAGPFLKKLGTPNIAIFVDDKMKLMRALKVRGMPTSFLLNREGRVVGKLAGIAEWDTPEAVALISYYTN